MRVNDYKNKFFEFLAENLRRLAELLSVKPPLEEDVFGDEQPASAREDWLARTRSVSSENWVDFAVGDETEPQIRENKFEPETGASAIETAIRENRIKSTVRENEIRSAIRQNKTEASNRENESEPEIQPPDSYFVDEPEEDFILKKSKNQTPIKTFFENRRKALKTRETFDNPAVSNKSEASDNPEISYKSESSDKPEILNKPKTFDKPEVFNKPETSVKPKFSSKFEAFDNSKTSNKPETFDNPKISSKPVNSVKPEIFDNPSISNKSEASDKFEISNKPEASVKTETFLAEKPKKPKTAARFFSFKTAGENRGEENAAPLEPLSETSRQSTAKDEKPLAPVKRNFRLSASEFTFENKTETSAPPAPDIISFVENQPPPKFEIPTFEQKKSAAIRINEIAPAKSKNIGGKPGRIVKKPSARRETSGQFPLESFARQNEHEAAAKISFEFPKRKTDSAAAIVTPKAKQSADAPVFSTPWKKSETGGEKYFKPEREKKTDNRPDDTEKFAVAESPWADLPEETAFKTGDDISINFSENARLRFLEGEQAGKN